jgi:hypothetical protein
VARPAALRQVAALEILGAATPAAAAPAASGPWASLLAAHAAAARDAPGDMRAALARAAQIDAALALDHEAFLATMPGAPPPPDGLLDRLRARAAAAEATSGTTPASALRAGTTLHSLGLLLVARADLDAAAGCARACLALAPPPWAASLPAALAAGIEAGAALARGDAAGAAAALDGVTLGPWIHLAGEVPECALVAERRLRARALAALGRDAEAEAWRVPPAMLRPLEWGVGAAA